MPVRTAVDVVEDIRELCRKWTDEANMVLGLGEIGRGLEASAKAQREAARQIMELMYGDE